MSVFRHPSNPKVFQRKLAVGELLCVLDRLPFIAQYVSFCHLAHFYKVRTKKSLNVSTKYAWIAMMTETSEIKEAHSRVFVRYGKTKGEIWIKKSDFRGNLGGF